MLTQHGAAAQEVSVRRKVELVLGAARALAFLHNRKPSPIVHRDLNPRTLMIAGFAHEVRL